MTAFSRHWKRLEKQKSWLIHLIASSKRDIYLSPEQGSWSAFEVACHLYQVEALWLGSLKKYPMKDAKIQTGWNASLKSQLLRISLFLPIKFRVPPVAAIKEAPAQTWEELQSKWGALRLELRQELEMIPKEKYSFAALKHPLVGYLNVNQTLIFIGDHFFHHKSQLKKLLS